MRVALVIERFLPRGGGVESVAWNVAAALVRHGMEVHVLCRDGEDQAGVTRHALAVPTFWQPLRVVAFSRAAARCAEREGFDVVHSFSRTRRQDVFRAGGGCHADYLERAHGPLGRRLRRLSPRHALLLGIERAVFADPRQIIQCNSTMVRDQIAARHGVAGERFVVIPNGVDLDRFRPGEPAETEALRAELSTPAGPAWLFAGSGFPRKGLDTALKALALAGSSGTLWVAGGDAPGPWQERAAALGLGDRVRFLGARDDLERLYAAADALLLPTRYDAFANVCLEALACGCPVVTSGTNGAADVAAEAGIVVEDPEDAAGFAKALEQLGEGETRARLAARARPVAERFGWDVHAEALQALYRRVAGSDPRGVAA